MNNFKTAKENWFKVNQPTGKALGYPDCCIKEFCNQPPEMLKYLKPKKIDIIRYNAGCIQGQFTGFIPCSFHAKQIRSGKIKINDLIKDRDILLPPFPLA